MTGIAMSLVGAHKEPDTDEADEWVTESDSDTAIDKEDSELARCTRTFTHKNLDDPKRDIRLMRVLQNEGEDIVCELKSFTTSCRAALSYYALSYTWGPITPTFTITVNEQPFTVRENLYHCLSRMKQSRFNRWIWVDQLCIDQYNLLERNAQVTNMVDIYRGAGEVVIWLGPANEHTQTATRYIYEQQSKTPDPRNITWTKEEEAAIDNLFSNPYWTRTWIVQENVHAKFKKIVWGRCQIAPHGLANLYETHVLHFQEHHRSIFLKLYSLANSWQNMELGRVINLYCDSHCQDPRDKVFGLLGLIPDTPDKRYSLEVDYGKTVEEVFFDAVRALATAGYESSQKGQYPEYGFEGFLKLIWKLRREMMPDELDVTEEEFVDLCKKDDPKGGDAPSPRKWLQTANKYLPKLAEKHDCSRLSRLQAPFQS